MQERLFMLAFDHRASFRKIFPQYAPREQRAKISEAKGMILDAALLAIKRGKIKRNEAAILCDEEYGALVLKRANLERVAAALPLEKSGREEFEFEYGNGFGRHVKKFAPTYAKVLVRYNPTNQQANLRQLKRLLRLQEWLGSKKIPLLFELLVLPTKKQLDAPGGKDAFDKKIRPKLTIQAITEIAKAGIRPAIWKLEGMDSLNDARTTYRTALRLAPQSKIIVLGRGESFARVQKWISIGKKAGAAGFAVGRTIFKEALEAFASKKISRKAAVEKMSRNYASLAKEFTSTR
ncbi:hypothetical protein AUJ14_02695 [Candidatus Micrarchaeota archaeon CG1_02_55_22]|nr:MAG: hypothetical protein AUJ14_02695 [Candidatus Micrarchaeota archaeon CG1_02_55_22]